MAELFNPFKPGTGHMPPVLAGRGTETKYLAKALDLLLGPFATDRNRLASDPVPPVKIIGPRGVGKTTLLSWTKRQAESRRIRVIHCAQLEQADAKDDPMGRLMARMIDSMGLMSRMSAKLGLKIFGAVDISLASSNPTLAYESMTKSLVAKGPLLIVLDEVQHFNPGYLSIVLQTSQELINEGRPLMVVLAGTPGLDNHLLNSNTTFTLRSDEIYLNTLSEEAAREALKIPFERDGVEVSPDVLEAMVKLTDCYPYFIQLVGAAVWDAMTEAGRKDIDIELVKQIEEKARKRRISLYEKAYGQMRANRLLPYARMVMKLLEENGGKMGVNPLIDALAAAVPEIDDVQAQQICRDLQEDGFIWNLDGQIEPGIPSFFSYFKEQQAQ